MEYLEYLFIVNPIAGGVSKAPFYDLIKREHERLPFSYQVYRTTGERDEEGIRQLLSSYSAKNLIAVGGDGTFTQVAKIAMTLDLAVGLIPFGSANGMARELGINKVMEEAWQVIRHKQFRRIDLIQINQVSYSLHISDVGLNARIIKRYVKEKKRGKVAYLRQFLKEFPRSKRIKYKLKIDGQTFKGKAYMIALANASRYGTGAFINPNGKLDDGLFEVCIAKSISLKSVILRLLSILKKDIQDQTLVIHSGKRAELKLERSHTLQIDGELADDVDKIQASIIPQGVKVLV